MRLDTTFVCLDLMTNTYLAKIFHLLLQLLFAFCQYCDAGLSPQHNCDIDLSSFLLFICYCQQCTVKMPFSFNLISCVALFVIDHGMCMLTERLPAHAVHKSNRALASFVKRVLPGMSP